jgi:hypothetical protein
MKFSIDRLETKQTCNNRSKIKCDFDSKLIQIQGKGENQKRLETLEVLAEKMRMSSSINCSYLKRKPNAKERTFFYRKYKNLTKGKKIHYEPLNPET